VRRIAAHDITFAVEHAALSPLTAWESFYVIVGSSAAALTGLQFVVIVLSAESRLGSEATTRAFGTPTVVHFCAVLLISAILSAPWHTLSNPGTALDVCGVLGLVYSLYIIRHARGQTEYSPVLEDWIWHVILPVAGYAALFTAAFTLRQHPESSLFLIGGTALLLLFIGIHNAWDSVTYIADTRRTSEPEKK
jgi:hypothetical protein